MQKDGDGHGVENGAREDEGAGARGTEAADDEGRGQGCNGGSEGECLRDRPCARDGEVEGHEEVRVEVRLDGDVEDGEVEESEGAAGAEGPGFEKLEREEGVRGQIWTRLPDGEEDEEEDACEDHEP